MGLSSITIASRLRYLLFFGCVAVVLWCAIVGWYNPLRFRVFAGDDLRLFETAPQGTAALIRGMAAAYKFRPVTALLDAVVARLSHGDFRIVATLTLAIHALNAVLLFHLLQRYMRASVAVATGLVLIGTLNRFATYLYLQEQALMEGAGITLLLLLLASVLRFVRSPTTGRAVATSLLFLVLVHIHERYLMLAPPLLGVAAMGWRVRRGSAITLALLVVGGALTNLLLKKLWLATPLLVGTETRLIEFNLGQILAFFWAGALNLFGLNFGPSYLSVQHFLESPRWVRGVSIAAAFLAVALLVNGGIALARARESSEPRWKEALVMLSCVAVLLVSASVTFRQEYRWLYPAYLVFLIFLSGLLRAAAGGAWPTALVTVFIVCSFSREAYLATCYSRFVAAQAYTTANDLVETLDHTNTSGKDAVLVRGEVPDSSWVFLGQTFSRYYRLPPIEFTGATDATEQTERRQLVLDYASATHHFIIPPPEQRSVDTAAHAADFSALEAAARQMQPNPTLATPTHTPMFVMPEDGAPSVVAVSPVEVVVPVPQPHATLHVSFSHVYGLGDGVDLELIARTTGGEKPLVSRNVPPLKAGNQFLWRRYDIPLPDDAQQIKLRVLSKSGDSTADWLAIRDFSFD